MTDNVVPTLSSNGWVEDPTVKMDRLLSYYFTNNFSQSLLYIGSIKSLQYLIHEYGKDQIDFRSKLESDLKAYLLNYFTSVDLTVTTVDSTSTTTNGYTVIILAAIVQNRVTYSLGKQLQIADGSLVKIFNYNNLGSI